MKVDKQQRRSWAAGVKRINNIQMIKKSEAMIEKNVKKLLLLVRMINMWTYQ